MSEYSLYIQSNAGGRGQNEDCYASKQSPLGLLVVVCDGMGGTEGGKLAADLACRTVTGMFSSLKEDPVKGIVQAIEKANQLIYENSRRNGQGMGTTIAALLLTQKEATFFHAGDSRIYHLRKGQVEKRTADHSRVGEMVRRGILNDEQARLSAESHIISKALGIEPTVEVEITGGITFQKGDRFAVCTDGIWGTMREEELVEKVGSDEPVGAITNTVIQEINASQFAAGGGHDNMTLALVEINGGGLAVPKISNSGLLNIVLGIGLAISLFYHFKQPGTVAEEKKPVATDSTRKDSSIIARPAAGESKKTTNANQQKKSK